MPSPKLPRWHSTSFVIPTKVGTPSLTAALSKSISSLITDSIQIAYEGIPPENGSGSFTNATHAGVPIVSTLSQPYGAADWWPCSQDLNDKVDSVLLVISVPPGNRAAANGMLISEEHRADRSIYRWKHKHPMAAYLVGVSVTNYAGMTEKVPAFAGMTEKE